MISHPLYHATPFVLLAEASTASESWVITLLNYGVAGAMLLWFMWRDKLDREERKQERLEQQKRHEENLSVQKEMADALRTNTDLMIVGFGAMKNIDKGYADLLEKFRTQHPIGGT